MAAYESRVASKRVSATRSAAMDGRRSRPREPKISIVVPARNEARNVTTVLPMLPPVHQIVLVDGHSSDGTIEAALSVRPDVTVIRQVRRGKGNALAAGFQASTGDIIVTFDADGSADPAEIDRFVECLLAGADFAKGSRFLEGGGSHDITLLRRLGNSFLGATANAAFGAGYTDLCYGYNAFWADILPVLALPDPNVGSAEEMYPGDGFEIETLVNVRVAAAGLDVREIPSVELNRLHGVSNLNAVRDGIRVLRTVIDERNHARRLRRPAVVGRTIDLRIQESPE